MLAVIIVEAFQLHLEMVSELIRHTCLDSKKIQNTLMLNIRVLGTSPGVTLLLAPPGPWYLLYPKGCPHLVCPAFLGITNDIS